MAREDKLFSSAVVHAHRARLAAPIVGSVCMYHTRVEIFFTVSGSPVCAARRAPPIAPFRSVSVRNSCFFPRFLPPCLRFPHRLSARQQRQEHTGVRQQGFRGDPRGPRNNQDSHLLRESARGAPLYYASQLKCRRSIASLRYFARSAWRKKSAHLPFRMSRQLSCTRTCTVKSLRSCSPPVFVATPPLWRRAPTTTDPTFAAATRRRRRTRKSAWRGGICTTTSRRL